jgi:hemolysin activation/secretion protein
VLRAKASEGGVGGRRRTIRCGLLTLAVGFGIPVSASAQAPPPPPPTPAPPTREEVTRPEPRPAPLPPARLEVQGGIERAPCFLESPEYAAIKFTLRDVVFDGLQGISADELRSAYAPLIGREQPVSVICEIRDRAATALRQAGYIAAVEVPEQRIAEGTVHFRVLMAKLVQVRVRGNATGAEHAIAAYLDKLTGEPVFNRFDAERYLLLASDIPGYTVRLTLRPAGTVPGEVIGDVTVVRTPAYVDANVQDYGSKALGRWGGLLRAQLYGLTGLGDRTTLAVFSTSDLKEQQTVQAGHDFRLGSEGLTIGGNFTYSWARPSIGEGSDFRSRTLLATLETGYPFIRRQSHTVRGSAGMDFVNQDVELDGIKLSRDRLRVAFARLAADALGRDQGFTLVEPHWRVSGLLELRQGVDFLGATQSCGADGSGCLGPGDVPPSRIEADGMATVFRGSGYGEFRPIPKLTFALGVRGQYTNQPLLSFEEFSAGNYTVGRGYDPGTLLGDRGIGVQAEIRAGSIYPRSPKSLGLEGYAFFDHARIHNQDRLFVDESSRKLSSVGAGARASWNRFFLDAALALPLTHVGLENKKPDPRFLVSLTTRLWPWSVR